jgi:leader peptidase (prepilin peptidase)/N-methyltransferase
MEQLVLCVIFAILGLCMGSFAAATVWRLRAHQLVGDKAAGEDFDKKEYTKLLPLAKVTPTTDRSRCLHCGHTLAWYDLIPLVSWVRTGGRCRYCRGSIGRFEPLMELGVGTLFILSYLVWTDMAQSPVAALQLALWLIAGVGLAILFAYDFKWFILPDSVVFPLIAIGGCMATLGIMNSPDILLATINCALAVGVLSGLYWLLWILSKGQWIGFGDVKLGLALALLLGDWKLACLTLFAANLIGCIIVIPGMLMGKIHRHTRVPFGPLLIAGAIFAMLFGTQLVERYFGTLL